MLVALAWWRLYSGGFVPSPKNPNDQSNFCAFPNGLWSSLETFAPVINLHERENWQPAPGHEWVTNWEKLLSLAGWIIVPLGVAANDRLDLGDLLPDPPSVAKRFATLTPEP